MRFPAMIVLAGVLAAVAHGQFLVPDQQYRCPPDDTACRATYKPTASEAGLSEYNHRPYTINYVEYTDKGTLWDPKELDDAINQIKAAEDDGHQRPLVVVYVHGWQNNASIDSGDVAEFRGLMSRLADDYPAGLDGKAPQVVGIYLAWRGLTFTIEPFKHIVSYWPRRHTARKVGSAGIHSTVCAIENAVRDNRPNTFLIFAGHSFGARVLEAAIDSKNSSGQCETMQDYFNRLHSLALSTAHDTHFLQAQPFRLSQLPADLIIYVNAATSSEKAHERVAQIKRDCPNARSAYVCRADPLYIAFSSTSDFATGVLMPLANLLWPDFRTDGFHVFSAADSPWMHTHAAPKRGCPTGEKICFTIAGGQSKPAEYYLPRIARRAEVPGTEGNPLGTDPFWIFNVHSNLVSGHGDVWNPNVVNMLTVILQNNGRFEEIRKAAAAAAKQ